MTIRKLMLIVLIIVSIVSVAVNAFVLASLTDRYFTDYLRQSYEIHVNEIVDYATAALSGDDVSYSQMAMELESHLDDPITGIRLYDPSGQLLVEVEDFNVAGRMMDGMMGGHMMDRFIGASSDEINQIELEKDGRLIGILNIQVHGLAENSFIARRFKASLVSNSSYSVLIALGIALVIGAFVSHRMSKSLRETARMASGIQLGQEPISGDSTIKEISAIRESLMELDARLRLKQKSRKSMIDQLVHQTRTPLTILKSHLEALEDGVMDLTVDEMTTCRNQIDNLTDIISNMSAMIDADRDIREIVSEKFDLHHLLKQIIAGLNVQFEAKGISLNMVSRGQVNLETDKYRLSQAIYNVIINAYKYTEAGGRVDVEYESAEGRLRIRIRDTGLGIPKEDRDRIFQAYFRSRKIMHMEGDGIGLYIVKENLKEIGGDIRVQSETGRGSTFIIEIPMKMVEED